jgi:hypothetical protein
MENLVIEEVNLNETPEQILAPNSHHHGHAVAAFAWS